MKLLTFTRPGDSTKRIGGLTGKGEVVDLVAADASYKAEKGDRDPAGFARATIPPDMVEFIEGGKNSLKAAETAIAHAEDKRDQGRPSGIHSEKLLLTQDEITFLPPVLRPSKMISAGMNYREHLADSGRAEPDKPVAFLQLPSTFVGHRGFVVWTQDTPTLDYEIELAFVIEPERQIH